MRSNYSTITSSGVHPRQLTAATPKIGGLANDFFLFNLGDAQVTYMLPSLKLTARTRKWMVGNIVSFWVGLFSGANC